MLVRAALHVMQPTRLRSCFREYPLFDEVTNLL